MEVSRRDFLKTLGLSCAALMLHETGFSHFVPLAKARISLLDSAAYVPTICGMCPSCCSITARVKGGRVERILGNPNGYPTNRGRVCARGEMGIYRLYHPDRLKYPLVRAGGERGEWVFKKAEWSHLVQIMAKHLREKFERGEGPKIAAIGGWVAWDHYAPFVLATLHTLGTTNFTIVPMTGCLLPKTVGWTTSIGLGAHFQFITDYDNVKYLIVVKRNVAGSLAVPHGCRFGPNLGKFKLVVLDPRLSETAAKADEWIPIKPGTDLAFLLAMMNVIVNEGLYDVGYLARYTNAPMLVKKSGDPYKIYEDKDRGRHEYYVWDEALGKAVPHGAATSPALEGVFTVDGEEVITAFALFKEKIKEYTPAWAEEITDVPAETIERIAREFATTRPSAIDTGWHDPKHVNSALIWRAAGLLNALVGSVCREGGILFSASGVEASKGMWWKMFLKPESDALSQWLKSKGVIAYPFGWAYQAFYDLLTGKFEYKVNGKPVPGKWTLIILGANPMRSQMDPKKWEEAFKSDNVEVIVDIDIMPSDTTPYADIILPDCTYLEREDFIYEAEYVPTVAFMSRFKASEPLYDCMPFEDMAIELMKAMGNEYYEKFFNILGSLLKVDPEALMRGYESEGLVGLKKAQAEAYGISYYKLMQDGYVVVKDESYVREENLKVLEEGLLATPSGRIEFYSLILKHLGQDPFIGWIPPMTFNKADPSQGIFYLLYGKAPTMVHTSTGDNPLLQRVTDESFFKVWMNKSTASTLGLKDGQVVYLESLGTNEKIACKLHLTNGIRPDCVYVAPAFGQESPMFTFKPGGIPFNKLVPLQWGPVVGGVLTEEVLVKVVGL